ncbi:MAG: tail fiber domain-containing protein [Burkholderia sp.]
MFGLNTGTAGTVITLPLASSVQVNARLHFFNVGPQVTVGFLGKDSASIGTINPGDWVTYASDGNAWWHIVARGRAGWNEYVGGNLSSGGLMTAPSMLATSVDAGGSGGQIRATQTNYGVMLRNDDVAAYLLSTDKGTPMGGFSKFRPFQWVLATGNVIIAGDGAQTTVGGPLTVSGQIFAAEGSAKAPGITFQNEGAADTGLFHISDGILGIACDGREKVRYSPSGAVYADRPVFAGNTPWDTGNLNPSSYAPLAGATFSGGVVNRNAAANQPAAFQSSSDIGTVWGNWNNTATAAMQVDCPNDSLAYVGMRWTRWGSRHLAGISATAGGSEATSPTIVFSFGANANSHTFYAGGNAQFAGSLTQLSDYRVKSNVEEIDGNAALAALLASRPVEFDRTDTETHEVGFIAHELQDSFPLLVKGKKDAMKATQPDLSEGPPTSPLEVPDLQSVNYIGMVPYLVAALSAAVRRIEQLERKANAQ